MHYITHKHSSYRCCYILTWETAPRINAPQRFRFNRTGIIRSNLWNSPA